MEIILIATIIILAITIGSLFSRVSVLENEMTAILLSQAKGVKVPTVVIAEEPQKKEEVKLETVENVAQEKAYPSLKYTDEPNVIERFVAWCLKDVIIKLGGLIVLLGVTFFLSLAFKYIGDGTKVLIGYMFALTIGGFGYWWLGKSRDSGTVLLAIGAGVGLFATYSGMYVYGIYSPVLGTAISCFISFVVGVIAILKDLRELSFASFLLALLSPLTFGYFSFDVLGVFIYIMFISVAAAYVDYKKDWRELPIMAFLGACLYSVIAIGKAGNLDMYMMLIAFVQALILTAYSIFKISKSKLLDNVDSTILLISAVYVLFWIYNGAAENMQAFIMVIWAAVFAGLATAVHLLAENKNATLLYSAVSVLYMFIATAKIFDGATLSIVFIVEGFLVTMLAHFITRDFHRTLLASLTTFVGIVSTLFHFENTMSSQDVFVVLLQSASILTIGTVVYMYHNQKENRDASTALAYPAISVFFLTMLTINQIDGSKPIILVLTALYMATMLYAIFVIKNVFMTAVAWLGFAGVYIYIFAELISSSMKTTPDFNLFGVALVYMIIVGAVLGLLSSRGVKDLLAFVGAISIMAAYLVWVVAHALMTPGVATLVSLVIYSVVGYILLIIGNIRDENINIKHAGQAVLCLVAARVIFLDAWNYSKAAGVAICIVVGLILIATMFITNKKEKN